MQFIEYSGSSSYKPSKRYGFWKFMFDVFMIILSSGLWLIWIFIREMRRR